MTKYLDESGLLYLWGKLKATFLHNASEGRFTGVSTNTSTGLMTFNVPTIAEHIYYDSNKNSTLKDKIDTIVSQGGEPNTIETVKVNGTALVPDANKAVNITFTDSDTKNTAGSTNSNSKLYLVGATSLAANPQTYSRDSVYVGTDGKLRSGFGINSATDAQSIVVTDKDITYDMSLAGGDVIAIIDKTTGKVKPSSEAFDTILEGFIDEINGINANNEGLWFNYAICNTLSDLAAKTATLISGSISYILDNNNLPTYKEGTQVVVKFANKNTVSAPTLNINNIGAKEIHINGSAISGELNAGVLNNYVLLEYDGTYWNIVGPTTTDSIIWDGGGTVFDSNNSLSGCLRQLNGDMETLTGRAIKTVAYDTTTHTITTTKVPNGSTAQNVVTATQIVSDGGGAPLASPAFTGIPTAPTATAGTNTTQIATTSFVNTAITNALGNFTGVSYEVVQTLPASGAAGTIYLISNSGTNPNIYDEYIYVNNGFEKIGTTDVDLTNYLTEETDPIFTASAAHGITSTDISNWNGKANQSTTYTKTEVDALFEDVAYLGDDDGQATTLDFDPQADTVWNIPQTLGSSQQAQARANIGVVDVSGTNDGTNWTSITIGSTTKAIPSGGGGGETNVIESISINGTTQTVTNKNVDLPVPVSATIETIVTLTEDQYTALATKDSSTLYIIVES